MLTLTPAYGRDYKSKKAVTEDFNNDKDFVAHSYDPKQLGYYTNKQDLKQMGAKQVRIRYSKMQKVMMMEVK
jgi:hypothetical protein